MLANPKVGRRVRIHYRKAIAAVMPLHGRLGTVAIACRGPGPRNHGVELDGVELDGGGVVSVPCGNLMAIREEGGDGP